VFIAQSPVPTRRTYIFAIGQESEFRGWGSYILIFTSGELVAERNQLKVATVKSNRSFDAGGTDNPFITFTANIAITDLKTTLCRQ
jgi:hypothetical protein